LLRTIDELLEEYASMVILKATDRNEIIGFVRARIVEGTCHIGGLVIHPNRQNKGIGKQLMAAIERQFSDDQRFELFTGHRSQKNLAFYSKVGYREFKREPLSAEAMLVCMDKMPQKAAEQQSVNLG
jgi:ribosomal protein S18 acetylase RimI-like enzyme